MGQDKLTVEIANGTPPSAIAPWLPRAIAKEEQWVEIAEGAGLKWRSDR